MLIFLKKKINRQLLKVYLNYYYEIEIDDIRLSKIIINFRFIIF